MKLSLESSLFWEEKNQLLLIIGDKEIAFYDIETQKILSRLKFSFLTTRKYTFFRYPGERRGTKIFEKKGPIFVNFDQKKKKIFVIKNIYSGENIRKFKTCFTSEVTCLLGCKETLAFTILKYDEKLKFSISKRMKKIKNYNINSIFLAEDETGESEIWVKKLSKCWRRKLTGIDVYDNNFNLIRNILFDISNIEKLTDFQDSINYSNFVNYRREESTRPYKSSLYNFELDYFKNSRKILIFCEENSYYYPKQGDNKCLAIVLREGNKAKYLQLTGLKLCYRINFYQISSFIFDRKEIVRRDRETCSSIYANAVIRREWYDNQIYFFDHTDIVKEIERCLDQEEEE